MLFPANKLKEGWSKFLDKMKTKKDKKAKIKELERAMMIRAIAAQSGLTNEDEASSREGSIHSQQNFDSVRRALLSQVGLKHGCCLPANLLK